MTATWPTPPQSPDAPALVDAHERLIMERLVDGIFQRLHDAGIPHCLLRNRDRIPQGLLGWTDLDLMVADTVTLRQAVTLFADLEPALIAPVRDGFAAMFFPAGRRFLRVDLFTGDIEWRAASYGHNDEILASRWDDEGIMVASRAHQTFLAWFSRLLQHRDMAPRYAPVVTDTMRAEPAAFRQLLVQTFGTTLGEDLAAMAQEGRPQEAEAIVGRLRRELWTRAFRRHPARTFLRVTKQLWNALEHRLHPAGLSVAIAGPDWTMNRDVCEAIATLPSRRIPFVIAEYWPRHRTIAPESPSLADRLYAVARSGARSAGPRMPSSIGLVAWYGASAFVLADQWLREVVWIRQRLAHAKLVLRDDDLPASRGGDTRHPDRAPWLGRLYPRSDVVIALAPQGDGDPARPTPEAALVDASQPFDDVIRDVLGIVAGVTEARTRSRWHLSPRTTPAPRTVPIRDGGAPYPPQRVRSDAGGR